MIDTYEMGDKCRVDLSAAYQARIRCGVGLKDTDVNQCYLLTWIMKHKKKLHLTFLFHGHANHPFHPSMFDVFRIAPTILTEDGVVEASVDKLL